MPPPRPELQLRPATPEDDPFLYELSLTSHPEQAGLPEPMRRMQHTMRERSYAQTPGEVTHAIIELGGAPIGRFVAAHTEESVEFVDLAVAPEARGKGVGSYIYRTLMEQARERGVPLRLFVVKTNAGAIRLNQRLGFEVARDTGMHLVMEWRAGDANER